MIPVTKPVDSAASDSAPKKVSGASLYGTGKARPDASSANGTGKTRPDAPLMERAKPARAHPQHQSVNAMIVPPRAVHARTISRREGGRRVIRAAKRKKRPIKAVMLNPVRPLLTDPAVVSLPQEKTLQLRRPMLRRAKNRLPAAMMKKQPQRSMAK